MNYLNCAFELLAILKAHKTYSHSFLLFCCFVQNSLKYKYNKKLLRLAKQANSTNIMRTEEQQWPTDMKWGYGRRRLQQAYWIWMIQLKRLTILTSEKKFKENKLQIIMMPKHYITVFQTKPCVKIVITSDLTSKQQKVDGKIVNLVL